MADSFLVLVPHKTLHGTISILIQRPKLATNVGKMGAVKNKMPFIPQCPGPAQSAAAEMPGDGRFSKPTLTGGSFLGGQVSENAFLSTDSACICSTVVACTLACWFVQESEQICISTANLQRTSGLQGGPFAGNGAGRPFAAAVPQGCVQALSYPGFGSWEPCAS